MNGRKSQIHRGLGAEGAPGRKPGCRLLYSTARETAKLVKSEHPRQPPAGPERQSHVVRPGNYCSWLRPSHRQKHLTWGCTGLRHLLASAPLLPIAEGDHRLDIDLARRHCSIQTGPRRERRSRYSRGVPPRLLLRLSCEAAPGEREPGVRSRATHGHAHWIQGRATGLLLLRAHGLATRCRR